MTSTVQPAARRQRDAALRRPGHDDAAADAGRRPRGSTPASSACRWTSAPPTAPGTRFGPRQIRAESCLIRPYNMATRAAPFDSLQVADIGDVAINTFNLPKSHGHHHGRLRRDPRPWLQSADAWRRPHARLPILRAMAKKHGPVGLIHVDAHADINDTCSARRSLTARRSAAPSRRACSTPTACVQIGLRGTGYAADDFDWPREQGFRVVQAEECWHKSLTPLMAEVRAQSATARSISPSTSTASTRPSRRAPARRRSAASPSSRAGDHSRLPGPESGRLRSGRGLAALRPAGNTALIGANLLFEMLCVLPGVKRR